MLETRLATTRMLRENAGSKVLGKASTRELYWSVGQMVTHLTSNGCNIEAGDLFGSGTVSGDAADALGSLLEITRAGKEPLPLPGGEQRTRSSRMATRSSSTGAAHERASYPSVSVDAPAVSRRRPRVEVGHIPGHLC